VTWPPLVSRDLCVKLNNVAEALVHYAAVEACLAEHIAGAAQPRSRARRARGSNTFGKLRASNLAALDLGRHRDAAASEQSAGTGSSRSSTSGSDVSFISDESGDVGASQGRAAVFADPNTAAATLPPVLQLASDEARHAVWSPQAHDMATSELPAAPACLSHQSLAVDLAGSAAGPDTRSHVQARQCSRNVVSSMGAVFGAALLHELRAIVAARAADVASRKAQATAQSKQAASATHALRLETAKRAWWRSRKAGSAQRASGSGGDEAAAQSVLNPGDIGGGTAECLERLMACIERELEVWAPRGVRVTTYR
jgi:hypothetical protein